MDTLCAGLLHDTVEDTRLGLRDLEQVFGPAVRRLVEGETKVSKLASKRLETQQGADEEAERLKSDCRAEAHAQAQAQAQAQAWQAQRGGARVSGGPDTGQGTSQGGEQSKAEAPGGSPSGGGSGGSGGEGQLEGKSMEERAKDVEQLWNLRQLLIAMSKDWRA